MQNNNNMNFLGFKDIIFHSLAEGKEFVDIYASVKNMNTCPQCGSKKIWIHDHRIQKIKNTHIRGKKCLIHLKKTRYECKSCGSRFEMSFILYLLLLIGIMFLQILFLEF